MTVLKAGSATDVGQVRAVNQDAVLSVEEHSLFGVADGIGGWRLNGHTLSHPAPPVLAEGKRTEIGWARCALTTEDLHVEAD